MLPLTAASVPRDDQLRARIGAFQPTFITGYIVGAGLLAAGAAMLIVELSAEEATSATVWLGPGRVGLAGRF